METSSKWKYIVLMLISTALAALGQLFFKESLAASGIILISLAIGLVAYILSTGIYLTVLSRAHLSWTYGIGGLSYIMATIFAVTILSEPVTLLRWIGVFVIFVGVVLIGLS
jgi:multidrug transporter EmrE-like cation transporter